VYKIAASAAQIKKTASLLHALSCASNKQNFILFSLFYELA